MLDGFDFITRLKIEFLLDVTIFCFIGIMFVCLFVNGATALSAPGPSHYRGFYITYNDVITVDKTPLDE